VAFKQVFGGASHSDEIGFQLGCGWVGAGKSRKKLRAGENRPIYIGNQGVEVPLGQV
jgi:hypothetical protein